MNAAQITELKQFFVITLDTALQPIRDDIKELKADVKNLQIGLKTLRQEMEDGFAGVGEALERIHTEDDHQNDLIKQLSNKWRKH